ncbi:hypothetical protein SAPIO_CDS8279 [Scedosporium apiospermum]|uniref:Rhodopsin domain-containing protein n=1 Tax=Pseudallescheria apiosperma TaxID=563466 RepID=A0A084FZA0_PSEDA|nr:uncharacterized protein SAPIO_CDS8279 [Scedosporium apiospermum]KEZ40412.1 hypothetical protein SAPIO_CDS8279 [Scedosporium apiospermum]
MADNTTVDVTDVPDEYIGQSVVPCAVISTAVAAAFVGLRFYTRVVEAGLGRHKQYLSTKQFETYLQANLFSSILYVASLTFTKLSILCLYLRILTYERTQLATKVLIATVTISHTYILTNLFVSCVPLKAFWDYSIRKNSYCHDSSIYWSNYILHIATDFLIFLLPLPVISKLRIPKKQKFGLLAVFLLAFGVCAVSVLRMVLFLDSNGPDRPNRGDITFTTISMANWSMIEICASIVCACMPTLKPLIMRIVPNFSRSSSPATDWHDDVAVMAGYERPLTVGTRPSRKNRLLSARDLLNSRTTTSDRVPPIMGGGLDGAERAGVTLGARRFSCGTCSDGASLQKAKVREEEYAMEDLSPVERDDLEAYRAGMQSPAESERPLRPSASDTRSVYEQQRR